MRSPTPKSIAASEAARSRISTVANAELAREITEAIGIINQRGLRPKAPRRDPAKARDAATVVEALESVRNAWRRLEAQGDPLGLRNGKSEAPPQSSAEPTPERRAKALDVDRKLVDRREVRRLKTTLDQLEDNKHLPKHLRLAFQQFCEAIAVALNVAVEERAASTARLVSDYGDAPLNAYGPREIPDRVLNARTLWRTLERELPQEMMDVVNQLVGEETGLLQRRPQSLQRYGNVFGWQQDKQAGAAGAMMAIMACATLHHALKRSIGRRPTQLQN